MLHSPSWNICIFPCLAPRLIRGFSLNMKMANMTFLWLLSDLVSFTPTYLLLLLVRFLMFWNVSLFHTVLTKKAHFAITRKDIFLSHPWWHVMVIKGFRPVLSDAKVNQLDCQINLEVFCHHFWNSIPSIQSHCGHCLHSL